MRMIDADAMLAELKPVTYEMEHSSVTIADMSNIMRDWVERQPTLTQQNEWMSVEEGLPTLPNYDYCSVMVNTAYKDNPKSRPMIYERATVRGKRIERWKYCWDRIADKPPDYWMPLPAPPGKEQNR